MATCFTDDATARYGGGAITLDGRDAILPFLAAVMGSTSILTSHRGDQPEIDIDGLDTAPGGWPLEDVVIDQNHGIIIHGVA